MLEYPPKGYLHTEEQLVGLVGNMPMSAFLLGTAGERGGDDGVGAGGNSVVEMMTMMILLFQRDPDYLDH